MTCTIYSAINFFSQLIAFSIVAKRGCTFHVQWSRFLSPPTLTFRSSSTCRAQIQWTRRVVSTAEIVIGNGGFVCEVKIRVAAGCMVINSAYIGRGQGESGKTLVRFHVIKLILLWLLIYALFWVLYLSPKPRLPYKPKQFCTLFRRWVLCQLDKGCSVLFHPVLYFNVAKWLKQDFYRNIANIYAPYTQSEWKIFKEAGQWFPLKSRLGVLVCIRFYTHHDGRWGNLWSRFPIHSSSFCIRGKPLLSLYVINLDEAIGFSQRWRMGFITKCNIHIPVLLKYVCTRRQLKRRRQA